MFNPEFYDDAVAKFTGTKLQISTDGSKHLEAVIGCDNYKER